MALESKHLRGGRPFKKNFPVLAISEERPEAGFTDLMMPLSLLFLFLTRTRKTKYTEFTYYFFFLISEYL